MTSPDDVVLQGVEPGRVWQTIDPLPFCVHHADGRREELAGTG